MKKSIFSIYILACITIGITHNLLLQASDEPIEQPARPRKKRKVETTTRTTTRKRPRSETYEKTTRPAKKQRVVERRYYRTGDDGGRYARGAIGGAASGAILGGIFGGGRGAGIGAGVGAAVGLTSAAASRPQGYVVEETYGEPEYGYQEEEEMEID